MCIARLAEIFLQSTLRFQADPTPFPFERLPPELRLQVYREAVGGAACCQLYQKTVSSAVRRRVNPDDTIMVIPFRTKKKGLQFWFGHPPKGESREINLGILAASRQTHDEAIAVLYQFRNFDFGLSINGVVPFLLSLSQHARENLSGITMDLHNKWKPCRHRGPDNQADWSKACIYIGENVNLKTLSVSINVKVDAGFRDLKWVKDLVKIKNLRYLTLQVIQHHSIGPVPVIASDKEGSLSATEDSVSEHLVPFWCFLREEMLE
ncbi:hypothetical protein HO173_008929 [Letharia columbiana]|uniref:DUF7730 domain-containing protein n=1 Tax=Letharia columbiana TaxID=112416 RepID=A0A8H6FQT5_9LECA|nr:uncharacterized protein HO173_008929 [Letharia columbiana]KAF6232966.1 hypothetical protein HO173_008929 [Letharia columbiana]